MKNLHDECWNINAYEVSESLAKKVLGYFTNKQFVSVLKKLLINTFKIKNLQLTIQFGLDFFYFLERGSSTNSFSDWQRKLLLRVLWNFMG